MSLLKLHGWRAYVFAMVTVVCAVLLKFLLFSTLAYDTPFLALNLAVIVSAWFGGGGAGILATILMSVISAVLFSQGLSTETALVRAVFMGIEGWMISVMAHSLQRESASHQSSLVEADHARRAAEMAEKAAEERERRLQVLTDALPVMISYVDREHRYRYHNKCYEETWGLTSDQIDGRLVSDVIGQEAFTKIKHYVDRALAGEAISYEMNINSPQRGIRQVRVDYVPEVDQTDKAVGFYTLVTDVTDERTAQRELVESVRRLRLITDSLPALIAQVGPDGRYRFNNQAYQDWFGRPAEEWSGKHLSEVVSLEAYERIRPNVERALAGETVQFEGEFDYPVGHKHVSAAYIPNHLPTGEPDGFFVLVQDVTQQRRAEAERRAGEQRLRAGYENAPVGFCEIDLDGRFTYVNNRMCQLTGYSREELLDKTTDDITHPEDRRVGDTSQQGAEPTTIERRYLRKDGSITWVSATTSYIQDADGNALYVVSVIQDINDRRKAEQALIESEAHFRGIFESGMLAVGFWHSDGRILGANIFLQKMLGYSAEEFIEGKVNWQKITPSEYAEADRKAMAEIEATGRCTPFEKIYIAKDGRRVPVLLGAALVEGTKGQGVFFALDISER
ncbi:MAG TPA: PAS domain S-box protein, partial [Blastocatellia bacterium]|nr:PAS domain S-box protein [Blastocatellia bacterium]